MASPSSAGDLGFGLGDIAGECSGGCQLRLGCLWAPLRFVLAGTGSQERALGFTGLEAIQAMLQRGERS